MLKSDPSGSPPSSGFNDPRLWFGGVLLFLGVCNLPYLDPAFIPIHDGMQNYQIFHYFYNELLTNGEFPRWIAYGSYGIPADFVQWVGLSPAQYLAGGVGWLLGVENTLLLFKFSMLFAVAMFAFGLSLLSQRLFSTLLTRFMVVAGGILAVNWLYQPFWDFYVFYLLPLVIYLVIRYCDSGRAGFLWLAGIVELFSLVGNLSYIAPVHFWLVLVPLVLPIFIRQPGLLTGLWQRQNRLHPYLALFILLGLLLAYFALHSVDFTTSLQPGRDPESARVPLKNFLSYGGYNLQAALLGMVSGYLVYTDNSFYVGLPPLLLFVYALFTVRNPFFLGLGLSILAIAWLSFGGLFARLVYYLPGMDLFRHLALMFGIWKILLLLAAGFGLERLLTRKKEDKKRWQPDRWTLFFSAALLLLVGDAALFQTELGHLPSQQISWGLIHGIVLRLSAMRLVVYALVIGVVWIGQKKSPPKKRPVFAPLLLLAMAYLFDMGSYQMRFLYLYPYMGREIPANLFRTGVVPFQSRRTPYAEDYEYPKLAGRPGQVLGLVVPKLSCVQVTYDYALYPFAHLDPCYAQNKRPLIRKESFL